MNEHLTTRPYRELVPAPGLDPIEMGVQGNLENIPSMGYLISAEVGVDQEWVSVRITHYDQFECSAASYWEDKDDGTAQAMVTVADATSVELAVTTPPAPDERIPTAYYHGIYIGDATLHALSTPERALLIENMIGTTGSTIMLQRRFDTTNNSSHLHRIVGIESEIPAVLTALADGMGLNKHDTEIFVTQTMAKVAQGERVHILNKLEKMNKGVEAPEGPWLPRLLGHLGISVKNR